MYAQKLITPATQPNISRRSLCKAFHFTNGMASMVLLLVITTADSVNGDVQLTQFTIKDDYSAHTCTQLLSCGPLIVLEGHTKSECACRALHYQVDMFMYQESNRSCLLCQQTLAGDNIITGVHASLFVYVTSKTLFICIWIQPSLLDYFISVHICILILEPVYSWYE